MSTPAAADTDNSSPITQSVGHQSPPADKLTKKAVIERWIEKAAIAHLSNHGWCVAKSVSGNSKASWGIDFFES